MSWTGHEIDMFKIGPAGQYPGIGCEMEWNNKDPFYDRDLNNFRLLLDLHAISVASIQYT